MLKKLSVFPLIMSLVLLWLCSLGIHSVAHQARNGSFWYGDEGVLAPHREDFSADIDPVVLKTWGPGTEVLKVYRTLSNTKWFLEDDFEDFSQIVENWPWYVVMTGPQAYEAYRADENGQLKKAGGASTDRTNLPYGLFGLSHEIIEKALAGIEYEDYIITESAAVIVWVRRKTEDLFLTYPTRPDLMGIETGAIYTLDELKNTLSNAYHNE